jgi:hypothetical protein
MPPNGSQLRITISPRAEYKRSLPPYVSCAKSTNPRARGKWVENHTESPMTSKFLSYAGNPALHILVGLGSRS